MNITRRTYLILGAVAFWILIGIVLRYKAPLLAQNESVLPANAPVDSIESGYEGMQELSEQRMISSSLAMMDSIFQDDNISVDSLRKLVEDFGLSKGIIPYDTYSKHTYSLDVNAPAVDLSRSPEPNGVIDGIQRKYFINSNLVAVQVEVRNSIVVSEIHLHPNGQIYTVKRLYEGSPDGYCKYVDLENRVVLEGNYSVGKMTGFWDTPIMANFDMGNQNLRNEYPGVIDKTLCLIKWYQLSSENRIECMK